MASRVSIGQMSVSIGQMRLEDERHGNALVDDEAEEEEEEE